MNALRKISQKVRNIENIMILARVFKNQAQINKCMQEIETIQKEAILQKLIKTLGLGKS